MTDDFRAALIAHAQTCLDRAPRAQTEAATQQYLILPFVQLLGYDPLDPDEVIPEAHASFSDKFKNRVDYAICQGGQPVIAIECKKVGTLVEANRGELKGYFNAVPTVKLGILTDGLVYQLYTDTGLENMMDDVPFASVDLGDVAREQIDQTALEALGKLRKGTFDPAYVGADARRRIYTGQYADALDRSLANPDERFVRALIDIAGIEGRRTGRMVEEHAPIVRDAAEVLLDRKILERVGFADRKDLVKISSEAAPAAAIPVGEPEAIPAAPRRERRGDHRDRAAGVRLRPHAPPVPDRGRRNAVRAARPHSPDRSQDGVLRLLQAGAEGAPLQLPRGPRPALPLRVRRRGRPADRDRRPLRHRPGARLHLPPARHRDGLTRRSSGPARERERRSAPPRLVERPIVISAAVPARRADAGAAIRLFPFHGSIRASREPAFHPPKTCRSRLNRGSVLLRGSVFTG